jgi:hypothetical protein
MRTPRCQVIIDAASSIADDAERAEMDSNGEITATFYRTYEALLW